MNFNSTLNIYYIFRTQVPQIDHLVDRSYVFSEKIAILSFTIKDQHIFEQIQLVDIVIGNQISLAEKGAEQKNHVLCVFLPKVMFIVIICKIIAPILLKQILEQARVHSNHLSRWTGRV